MPLDTGKQGSQNWHWLWVWPLWLLLIINSLVSNPGDSGLLPACIKLFQVYLLVCKQSEISDFQSEIESRSVMSNSLQPHGLLVVHGILQATILKLLAVSFSSGSSQPRDRTQVSHIVGGFFTSWANKEALQDPSRCFIKIRQPILLTFIGNQPNVKKFHLQLPRLQRKGDNFHVFSFLELIYL